MARTRVFTAEEARERKNARQREYMRRTGFECTNQFNKAHTRSFSMRFMEHEYDLADWLDAQENKAGYLKELIRKDMESKQGKGE